jgi:hypothetical protein
MIEMVGTDRRAVRDYPPSGTGDSRVFSRASHFMGSPWAAIRRESGRALRSRPTYWMVGSDGLGRPWLPLRASCFCLVIGISPRWG